jgi:hypothetical protein
MRKEDVIVGDKRITRTCEDNFFKPDDVGELIAARSSRGTPSTNFVPVVRLSLALARVMAHDGCG